MAIIHNIKNRVSYRRRHPEKSLLYRTVETYWPVFRKSQEKFGRNFPNFIKEEFDKYLKCGIAEFGFIRTYCHHCRDSEVVAFSCKKRGFCPSCCARRMNDEAAHLVDQVLPEVTMRQWVMSFPYRLRFKMANQPKLTTRILRVFNQVIFNYQKKKARHLGLPSARSGSVIFIQRFGSALNLNVHFHGLFTDGVFYKKSNEFDYRFFRLPEPTTEDLFEVSYKICDRVSKLLEKHYPEDSDQLEFEENLLGEMAELSVSHKSGFGSRAGQGLRRYGNRRFEEDTNWCRDPYSVNVEGFSLNARVWVSGRDREKLEKLIRYMSRGPIATERLSESFPNSLIYKLKTPWSDGTKYVSFSYLDFIARLVAIIPPPKMNLVRYFGVFAPNFKEREKIVPQKKQPKTSDKKEVLNSNSKFRRTRLLWSEMLKRTFKVDITVCARCGGYKDQIAVIKDQIIAKAILTSLKERTIFNPLQVIEERGPPEKINDWTEWNEFDQRGSW